MFVSVMKIISFKLAAMLSIVTFYVIRQLCGCRKPTLHSTCQPNFSKAETTTGGSLYRVPEHDSCHRMFRRIQDFYKIMPLFSWCDEKDIVFGILRLSGNFAYYGTRSRLIAICTGVRSEEVERGQILTVHFTQILFNVVPPYRKTHEHWVIS